MVFASMFRTLARNIAGLDSLSSNSLDGSIRLLKSQLLSSRGVNPCRLISKSTKCLDEIRCWKCSSVISWNSISCHSCKIIQKPRNEATYFQIMGVAPTFDLDSKALTDKFRKLQMQLHPDRFTHQSEDVKEISAAYSSLVNRAYKTLLSPLERGSYLLELNGHALLENEVHLPSEFLAEIMEINEELTDVQDEKELEKLSSGNQMKIEDLFRKLSLALKFEDWTTAREILGKLKYYSNIQDKIKEKERELAILQG